MLAACFAVGLLLSILIICVIKDDVPLILLKISGPQKYAELLKSETPEPIMRKIESMKYEQIKKQNLELFGYQTEGQ